MRNFLVSITRNAVSLLGVAVTTSSAVIIITLFSLEVVGLESGPYTGILAFLVLPGVFIAGLALIPAGIIYEKRKARRAVEQGRSSEAFPIIDLNRNRTRKLVLTFLLLSLVNVVILATATFKGVHVMESSEFCGSTCHVMHPERAVYQRSPHARVACVSCHIGPGADWFVKSKLSGAWQVVATTFDLYPRPIPTPIHNLRPARDTCEQCHWPSKFVGDRLKVYTSYANDETNTEMKSVLLLRVGGIQGRVAHGIHWHVDPGNQIRYRSDPTREKIYEVEMTLPDGTVKTYLPPELPEAAEAGEHASEWRVMDCVDCHNRPSHIYRAPENEVDEALRTGTLDRSLPFLRRESLRLLNGDYTSQEEARQGLAQDLDGYYREQHPDLYATRQDTISAAGAALGDIYSWNVFPAMAVEWGTYPNHLGHEDFPGCFRCHDEEHATEDGDTISQDCFTCHTLLAMEEENPEVLEMLRP